MHGMPEQYSRCIMHWGHCHIFYVYGNIFLQRPQSMVRCSDITISWSTGSAIALWILQSPYHHYVFLCASIFLAVIEGTSQKYMKCDEVLKRLAYSPSNKTENRTWFSLYHVCICIFTNSNVCRIVIILSLCTAFSLREYRFRINTQHNYRPYSWYLLESMLTSRDLMTHICFSKLYHNWFR